MLKGATTAAGLSGFPFIHSTAKAETRNVKFTLSWLPDPNYSYVFVARNQDFWTKRGMDVDIARGNGTLPAGEALAAGKFDIGLLPVSTLILLRARGLDLVSIGMIDYDASMCVAVLDDSPIRQPKDLEGKTVGQTLSSADAVFFPVFCEKTGIDMNKITRISLEPNVRNRALWDRKTDAITGYLSNLLPSSISAGFKTRYLLYSTHGISMYNNTVVVRPDFLRDNAKLCSDFVAGIDEGALYMFNRPEDTLKIYLSEVKEMAMSDNASDFARLGIKIYMLSVMGEPGVAEHGFGWIDDGKIDGMIDLIMKYQAPPNATRPKREELFRTDFAGRYRPTPKQWSAAVAYAEDVAATARAS